VPARQHDAWTIGFTTTDDFQNAEIIYEETLPKVKVALTRQPGQPKELPIVTGFLGKAMHSGGVPGLRRAAAACLLPPCRCTCMLSATRPALHQ
jgi:aspartate kinase